MTWAAILVATCVVWGTIGLAALLAVAYLVQVAPAIWCVYHATVPSGVVLGTWAAIGVEAVLWGLYGWWYSSTLRIWPSVSSASASALAIVGRIVTTQRRPPPSGVDGRDESRGLADSALGIGDALPRVCFFVETGGGHQCRARTWNSRSMSAVVL